MVDGTVRLEGDSLVGVLVLLNRIVALFRPQALDRASGVLTLPGNTGEELAKLKLKRNSPSSDRLGVAQGVIRGLLFRRALE